MKTRIVSAFGMASLAWVALAGAAPPSVERGAPLDLPGKPTGPIVVEYRLLTQPAVGVPLTIAINVRVEGNVGAIGIEANATAPQALLITQPVLIAAAATGYDWELTVVPLVAEAGYLRVAVTGSIEGVDQARSVTIPLRSAEVPASAPIAVAADGETLIALPVQETP